METDKTIIFHNPRCSKSRMAMGILEDQHCDIEIVDYLHEMTVDKLKETIKLLGIRPEELIRKKEQIFVENYRGSSHTDDEWIQIMVKHPILIERPIIIQDGKAIVGRESQKIINLIQH